MEVNRYNFMMEESDGGDDIRQHSLPWRSDDKVTIVMCGFASSYMYIPMAYRERTCNSA